jgi:hypothetical protein
MAIFKVVKYLFVPGNNEVDTLNNINQLISNAKFRENYKMKSAPKMNENDGKWKAIVELAINIDSSVSKESYSDFENEILLKEVKELEKNNILEHLKTSPQTAKDYIYSLENCFGIRCRSKEDTLTSLENIGLYKTADNYGLPMDGLLKLHGINIRSIQEYFNYAKKRPVQKTVADTLGVTVDYLEDLRQRKLA